MNHDRQIELDTTRIVMKNRENAQTVVGRGHDQERRAVRRRAGLGMIATVALLVALLAAPAAAAKPDRTVKGGGTTDTTSTTTATTSTDTTSTDTSTSTVTATGGSGKTATAAKSYDPVTSLGSMYNVVDQIGARSLWQRGITGAGVHVAVIDTGIAPVPALTGADKVVGMVDLSFESDVPEAVYLDTFGHGSHMAGIIAGRDPGADPATAHQRPGEFLGVAPDAGIVSVKVGDNTGAVDVSQVIAAIDWVVEHRDTNGFNIRVLNLSYSTDSFGGVEDPLFRAVERAWQAGIVVVVAAGNEGWNQATGGLSSPARDRYVVAVGGAKRAVYGGVEEFEIPSWASPGEYYTYDENGKRQRYWMSGYTGRMPDVIAPGAHIDSLRVPGSRVDVEHPEGHVTQTIMRGSGTSQSAAVVSGAAALLIQDRPELTPDQVKALFMGTAVPVWNEDEVVQGKGVIDVAAAAASPAPVVVQAHPTSSGLGSLEAARGTQHVTVNGTRIEGEITAWGTPWDPRAWLAAAATDSTWTDGTWDGASWTGASWTGASWTGASWTGASWTGASWTGASWTGASWTGASWTGASWTGASWTGASWTGASWTGASWTGASWTGASWTGAGWT